ncbi:DMT family transporter [Tepidibacillus sp. LV47]|uniref:DMT family transporter n=1 Tax=Tepidibacillus sp. LV47 TaxID=3398228 RepID=UPI003AACE5D4
MKQIYYVLLLFTSMLWAGNFVAGKFLIGHASFLTLTSIRWMIAVLFLLPFVWVKEKRLFPPKKSLFLLFLMGMTGVDLFNIFMFLALERTSADNVGLISALNPIAIAITSFFILKEKMSLRQVIGMVLSFLGVLVVISQGDWQRIQNFYFNTGDLFMLAAVGAWGLYSVVGKKVMNQVTPFMSTLWAGIFGVLILLPFNLFTFKVTNPNVSFWLATGYVSIGATVLGMVFWNLGVQKVGGTTSGMFLNFNPIFTAIFAYVLLNEHFSFVQMIGTLFVITGVYIFTLKSNSKQTEKNKEVNISA